MIIITYDWEDDINDLFTNDNRRKQVKKETDKLYILKLNKRERMKRNIYIIIYILPYKLMSDCSYVERNGLFVLSKDYQHGRIPMSK